MDSQKHSQNPWLSEVNDLVRGASGGFLFGVPLLYTMEVWWIGSYATMPRLLIAIVLTFMIVFMLNRTAGFRTTSDIDARDAAADSIEAIAVGMVCAGIMLVLLQEITVEDHLPAALGKLVYESVPFSLGVALANQFLSGQRSQGQEEPADPQQSKNQANKQNNNQDLLHATFTDVGGTSIGALIIAFNIAPTDEIPMLAAAVSELSLLGVLGASLIISYAIVFEAGFANQSKRQQQQGIFQRPFSETLMAYIVSLGAALGMLVFFGKLGIHDPWQLWLSHTILLGLPATVGGAAGRLAV
jgi:putative integral membrane protein (TIGR02587 family)